MHQLPQTIPSGHAAMHSPGGRLINYGKKCQSQGIRKEHLGYQDEAAIVHANGTVFWWVCARMCMHMHCMHVGDDMWARSMQQCISL